MKNFSAHIPESILEYSNTKGFITLLEFLNEYKRQKMYDSLVRGMNPILTSNTQFLMGYLYDFGFAQFPPDFPKICLDCLYLNAGNIMRFKGSPKGLKLYLQSLTLGLVSFDDSDYFPDAKFIFPNDTRFKGGYLPTSDNEDPYSLYNPADSVLNSSLVIDIETYFHDNTSIKEYIKSTILSFIPFFETNSAPTINYSQGTFQPIDNMSDLFNDVTDVTLDIRYPNSIS